VTGVQSYLLDTNILLRFLVQDDQHKASAVKRLIEGARSGKVVLDVPFVAIAEAIHTLRSFYGVPQDQAAREISNFLNGLGIRLTAPSWVLDALEECQRRGISFGDACIAAEARAGALTVASFDTDFDRFPGVIRFEPK
jgi:predicted nucleic acid-binding protein